MPSLVRSSLLRNLVIQEYPRGECYTEISTAAETRTTGDLVASSAKVVCFAGNASRCSSVCFVPIKNFGRQKEPVYHSSQTSPIQDIKASPHDPYVFASGAGNGTVALWTCMKDDQGLVDGDDHIDTRSIVFTSSNDASAKIDSLSFHPNAQGVLGVASESTLRIWDVHDPAKAFFENSRSHRGTMDISWLSDGVTVACLNGDRSLELVDPRQNSICSTVREAHAGSRWNGRVVAAPPSAHGALENCIYTTGCNRVRDREVAGWDSRKLEEPLFRKKVVGPGTGVLVPLVVPDTKLLFLAARGGNVLYAFELSDNDPFIYPIESASTSSSSFLSIANVPVPALDVWSCEVARVLKMTENSIDCLNVSIPRKYKGEFHSEMYPNSVDCFAAAISSQDWISGSNEKQKLVPVLDLVDRLGAGKEPEIEEEVQEVNEEEQETGSVEQKSNDEELLARSEVRKRFDNTMGYIPKFKYIKCRPVPKESTLYNIKPSTPAFMAVSSEKFAMTWQGVGSPIFTGQLSQLGKIPRPEKVELLRGHSLQVNCLEFNPFNERILVSGSEDSDIRVWNTDSSTSSSLVTMSSHIASVKGIKFHPSAGDMLSSISSDKTVKLWNVETGKELVSMSLDEDIPVSADWTYDGTRLIVSDRDGLVRLFDPRACKTVVQSQNSVHKGSKPVFVTGLGDTSYFLTSGSAKQGINEFSIWDSRSLKDPINTTALGDGSTSAWPMFIEDNGVVMFTTRGQCSFSVFEIETLQRTEIKPKFCGENPLSVHKCDDYLAPGGATTAVAMMPRRALDTNKLEVAKIYRLTQDALEPLSFTLPRASRIENYFADDVYADCRSGSAAFSVDGWFHGGNRKPSLQSMNPSGKEKFSVRKVEDAHETYQRAQNNVMKFRKQREADEERERKREETFSRFQQMKMKAKEAYSYSDDVDESEW